MKFLHIILLSDLWEKYHRKEFTKEFVKQLPDGDAALIVQLPVSLLVYLFTNFKRLVNLVRGKYKIRELDKNAILFTPVILFHYLFWEKFSLLFYIDFFLMNYQLKKIIKKRNKNRKLVLWVYFPYLKSFAAKFRKDILIYDQYDIYQMDVNGKINNKIKSLNSELIRKSDIVFNTSKYLYDISIELNRNSFYITNGNNFNLLYSSSKHKATLNLPVPGAKIIGYLGGIRDWIDFDLLEFIISQKNEVNFIFIGKIYPSAFKEMEKIRTHKNVIWMDYVQPEILPAYLSLFDAGLIPFKSTEFFKSVFPNKFYEYLASGIPAITTNLLELKKYDGIIGYSNNENEFLENCDRAINGYFNKYKNEYEKLSKENSWSVKAEEILNIIINTIYKK